MGDTGNILPIVHQYIVQYLINVSTWARLSALVAPYNVPLARNVTSQGREYQPLSPAFHCRM